jgi:Transposase IS66 family
MKALLGSLAKEPGPGGYENASTDYVAFPRSDEFLHAGFLQPLRKIDSRPILAYCLTHARRKVFELREDYPAECAVVLDAVGKVYGYEAETAGLNGERRLAYHREKSGPVINEVKPWIEVQFSDRKVEPNSNLGKALQYWLSHWGELTVWFRDPGTPLDNNESERALKQFILTRKNSIFFKTEHGAAVGEVLALSSPSRHYLLVGHSATIA